MSFSSPASRACWQLRETPVDSGFRLPGYWVWCGSPIRGEDGRYHLFASRWPKALAFHPHWLTNSEIVRASSDTPLGPYQFEEVVLPARGEKFWDGRMTHNPTVRFHDGNCFLFYTGTTYPGPAPSADAPAVDFRPPVGTAHANQRIGLAVSKSVLGPWQRFDRPILEPRVGKWDSLMTTNPAPCFLPDGGVLLIYKSVSRRGDLLRLGLARAARAEGPYERIKEEPVLARDETQDHLEDPFVWSEASGLFRLVAKDMCGGYTGQRGAGVLALSPDGVEWQIATPPLAYERRIAFENGTSLDPTFLERPQLLIENEIPQVIFFAIGLGDNSQPPSHANLRESWCIACPLS